MILASTVRAQPADYTPSLRLLIEVRDAETNEPLLGARVAVDSVARLTNRDGRILFRGLQPGETQIAATFLGYMTVDTTLALASSSRMSFLLTPQAFSLPEVEVSADRFNAARLRRSGFYDRRENRAGTFLTIEELEEAHARRRCK
ncbi:MAG: carboxypeptidase-like regulatory domain-containing protein, partial [Bacteroidota bacterium]